MKYQIKKNRTQRNFFKKEEQKRLVLKVISKTIVFNSSIRYKIQQRFLDLSNNSSLTRITNKCILTGRSRGVYRSFKFSRIKIRELATKGYLGGLAKYSW